MMRPEEKIFNVVCILAYLPDEVVLNTICLNEVYKAMIMLRGDRSIWHMVAEHILLFSDTPMKSWAIYTRDSLKEALALSATTEGYLH